MVIVKVKCRPKGRQIEHDLRSAPRIEVVILEIPFVRYEHIRNNKKVLRVWVPIEEGKISMGLRK